MANPSKRAGTAFENRVLSWLQDIFGDHVDRSGGNAPGRDFSGVPIPMEAKRRKRWEIPAWTRYLSKLHGPNRWVLWVAPRDRRLKDAPPELMVVPAQLGMELLFAYRHVHGDDWPEL